MPSCLHTLYIGSTYIGDRQQLCVGVCGSCGDRSAVVTKTMDCPVTTKKNKITGILKLWGIKDDKMTITNVSSPTRSWMPNIILSDMLNIISN